MHHNFPPSIPSPVYLPGDPELAASDSLQIPSDDPSSSLFDWSEFLDLNLEEILGQPELGADVGEDVSQSSENLGKIRKRDPRLLCSNFVAGRIPCACPELDAKLQEEEDSALPGKKRARMVRVSGGGHLRCQVPGCEADITELKGYHKRHRVCLRCANASAVVLDGESKRYCQQCGKFHLLSDFDEGKRSCRRKLERHNRRRRRKPNDSKVSPEKETEQIILADDASEDDDDIGKDGTCQSSFIEEREISLDLDGHVSNLCSAQNSEKHQDDNPALFSASVETHVDRQKQIPKYRHSSPASWENKNTFSSMCPTGRISFKLYDWNPAEFPRRLRLQIFQWLASMPIELEGYIRPGCIILTAFISMPEPMWLKLSEEPALFIRNLVASPGNMLSGRGTILVYLNNMMFRVTKDAKSVFKVKVKDQAPKLHYVYPWCFEAGKAMEFVACGSDLLQPKFRFLVSFSGKYLEHDIYVSSRCCKKKDGNMYNHQLMKITVPQTDRSHWGPVFIEVENQSGLSNFIPVLVGDKDTCAEMEILQQKFGTYSSSQQQMIPPRLACEDFTSRQVLFSDFILDLAWLLKKPNLGQQLTSCHIERFNHLLHFLIKNGSCVILERVVYAFKTAMGSSRVIGVSDSDMMLLRKTMGATQQILDQKLWGNDSSAMPALDHRFGQSFQMDNKIATQTSTLESGSNIPGVNRSFRSLTAGEAVPFLSGDVVMNVNTQTNHRKHCAPSLSKTFLTSHPLLAAVAAIGICCGVCAVVLHPRGVTHIATTIRRCLFDIS